MLLDMVGIGVAWAQLVSVTIRSIVGFFAHKWFTFRGDTADTVGTTAGQTVAYILQGVLNVPVSTAVVVGCVWLLGDWELGGKLLLHEMSARRQRAIADVIQYRLIGLIAQARDGLQRLHRNSCLHSEFRIQ